MKLFIITYLLAAAVVANAATYTAPSLIATHLNKRGSLEERFNSSLWSEIWSTYTNDTSFKTISMKFKVPELVYSNSTNSSTILIKNIVSDTLSFNGTALLGKISNDGSVSYSWILSFDDEVRLDLNLTAGDVIRSSMTVKSDQAVATLENLSRNETITYTKPSGPSFIQPIFAAWIVSSDFEYHRAQIPPKFGVIELSDVKFETANGGDWTDYIVSDLVSNNKTIIRADEINKSTLSFTWVG